MNLNLHKSIHFQDESGGRDDSGDIGGYESLPLWREGPLDKYSKQLAKSPIDDYNGFVNA
jgi:hypothetical protein